MWFATDTNIVEEILELKQNIRVYFYLRYRRKKTQHQGLPMLSFANPAFTEAENDAHAHAVDDADADADTDV